jgi:flagellar assembly factor FliW
MKTTQSRFGQIEYDPAKVLHFPEGMLGFESLHDFVVMANAKEGPLFWIQSVDDAEVAFVLTDPTNFYPEYLVMPDARERGKIGMHEGEMSHTLAVVTVHEGGKITLNLAAPLVYSGSNNQALQVVLEKSPWSTQHPLPVADEK